MIARHHCRRTASQRGFTLVEVMLTLAIMALMAAMVWPTLGEPFAAIRLEKAASKVRVRIGHQIAPVPCCSPSHRT